MYLTFTIISMISIMIAILEITEFLYHYFSKHSLDCGTSLKRLSQMRVISQILIRYKIDQEKLPP